MLNEKILESDKIAIKVEGGIIDVDMKRKLHKSEIIDAIITNCERKYSIDLSNPTLIVLVRGVNVYRGSQRYVTISVVRPSQIYSRYSSRLTCLSP